MANSDYPMALYRAGTSFDWDGRQTDSRVVADENEHLQAADDGWQEPADYFAPPVAKAKTKTKDDDA